MSITVRVGGHVVGVLTDFRASLRRYPVDMPAIPLIPRSGPFVVGVSNWLAGTNVSAPPHPKQES